MLVPSQTPSLVENIRFAPMVGKKMESEENLHRMLVVSTFTTSKLTSGFLQTHIRKMIILSYRINRVEILSFRKTFNINYNFVF